METWSKISLNNKFDAVSVVGVRTGNGVRWVDALTVTGDFDLGQALGWGNTVAHLDIASNSGNGPNGIADSLQGIDNAEVSTRSLRLYQAWIERGFWDGKANLRLGFSDLNTEFDYAESAGVLMAPSFGVGPEFGSTGFCGPSIYPSTALGARIRLKPTQQTDWSLAIVNAKAGVLGDDEGPDWSFDKGALIISEYAWSGKARVAVGYWAYTHDTDDMRSVDDEGAPVQRASQGGYATLDGPLPMLGEPYAGFLKVGLSDGRTTGVSASWQAGLTKQPAFAGRRNSVMSFGVSQAAVSDPARRNALDLGTDPGRSQTQFELTYADRINPYLTLQPDVQYVAKPAGDGAGNDIVVISMRAIIGF